MTSPQSALSTAQVVPEGSAQPMEEPHLKRKLEEKGDVQGEPLQKQAKCVLEEGSAQADQVQVEATDTARQDDQSRAKTSSLDAATEDKHDECAEVAEVASNTALGAVAPPPDSISGQAPFPHASANPGPAQAEQSLPSAPIHAAENTPVRRPPPAGPTSSLRKALCQPFRSPLLAKPTATNGGMKISGKTSSPSPTKSVVAVKSRMSIPIAQSPSVALKKKSPQDAELETLTAKLRTLKQAVKYKKEDQGNPLQDLIDIWRSKGQEAATELFSKFPPPNPEFAAESPYGNQQGASGWGWGDDDKADKPESGLGWEGVLGEERAEMEKGRDESREAQDNLNENQPSWNTGCMLERMGLPKDLLQWDDDTEDFA